MTESLSADITRPGPWLAHYSTAQTVFGHILPSKRLRLSPYRTMRDPMENKDLLFGARRWEEPEEEALGTLLDFADAIRRVRDGMCVLSFTQDAMKYEGDSRTYGCCWSRPRMWEQYADVHRGAALVFRRELLDSAVRAALREKGVWLQEVSYTPGGIGASEALWVDSADAKILKLAAIQEFVDRHHADLFFLKTDDWSTEYEYRAVFFNRGNGFAYVPFGDALVAVVVGERFPSWQLPGARAACEAAGVELKRLVWHQGGPKPVADVSSD